MTSPNPSDPLTNAVPPTGATCEKGDATPQIQESRPLFHTCEKGDATPQIQESRPLFHTEVEVTRFDKGDSKGENPSNLDATYVQTSSSGPAPDRMSKTNLDATLVAGPAPPPASTMRETPARPRRIGNYELIHELGRGGMGVVYKAMDLRLNRLVALKMIRAGTTASADEVDRFLKEARAEARLDHPNIVPLYEIGEAEGLPFFAMALVEGGSLEQRRIQGPLPPREAARLVLLVAEGVHHAHERGIVHRDLKPHNILLSADESTLSLSGSSGRGKQSSSGLGDSDSKTRTQPRGGPGMPIPKVSDFGLARVVDQEGMTATGDVMGTPSYMPPEQAAGRTHEIGPLTDVYALGAVLYALLTGRPPFLGSSPAETMRLVMDQDPVVPRQLNAGVPLDLQTICLKCLEKKPERRYASAALLAEDLDRFLNGEPILARPASILERAAKWVRRRPLVAALLAVVALLTLAGFVGISWEYRAAVRERNRAQRAEADAEEALAQAREERDAAVEARRRLVRAHVEQLGTAAPQTVPTILAALAEDRAAVLPHLRQTWDDTRANRLQRMRAGLALLPADPDVVKRPLAAWLLDTTDPHELLLTRDALVPFKNDLTAELWQRALDKQTPGPRAFRALVALAAFDSNSDHWPQAAVTAVEHLLAANPLYFELWTEALRPVRGALLKPLAEVFRSRRQGDKRLEAARILADYARDRADTLADLLLDADPEQYAVLVPAVAAQRDRTVERLKEELDKQPRPLWRDTALRSTWSALEPSVQQQLEAARGLVAERFAFCQTLPLAECESVMTALRTSGYRPIRFRPYLMGKVLRVAVVWTRDGREFKMLQHLQAGEVGPRDDRYRAQGFEPADAACYADEAGQERYAVVWVKASPEERKRVLYAGVTDLEHPSVWQGLKAQDYLPRTWQRFLSTGGTFKNTMIWEQPTAAGGGWEFRHASASQFAANVGPDKFQSDVSVGPNAPRLPGKTVHDQRRAEAAKQLAINADDLNALYRRAVACYHLGQFDQALADLDKYIAKVPNALYAYRYRALVQGHRGKAAEARKDLLEYQKRVNSHYAALIAEALVAVLLGEDDKSLAELETALTQNPWEPSFLYNAACAYATASGAVKDAAKARRYADRAVALLKDAVAQGYDNYDLMSDDSDLDAVRSHPGFAAVLALGHLEQQYAAVWRNSATREAQEVHGLDPEKHLERCRQLAAQGYRPVALSVSQTREGQPLVTASVWHRPIIAVTAQETLARRQAQAAVALVQLGRAERVWPLLQLTSDPRLRNYLIHLFNPLGTEPQALVQQLEKAEDVSQRRALLLGLGEVDLSRWPSGLREQLLPRLLALYRGDPDPGIHSAVDWLVGVRWNLAKEVQHLDAELAGQPAEQRRWYANKHGMTLAIFPGPVDSWMGSPLREPDRHASETLHRRHIPRSFALATKPVTVEQFRRFFTAVRQQYGDVIRHTYERKRSPSDDGPIISMSWFDAAMYCRWLSEQEGIPEDQMCYPPIDQIKPGVRLPADYLSRSGYRLPTEAEWEYACRAGAMTSRFYGESEDLLGQYAWYARNADNHAWPVGQLKPNDFGLFDVLGNVFQRCQVQTARTAVGSRQVTDMEELFLMPRNTDYSVLRGGAYSYPATAQRSAAYLTNLASARPNTDGFRVARTWRERSLESKK
jgi:serine/threonine protein kinase/formylglycine-generating enzyme required for sulfatase activity